MVEKVDESLQIFIFIVEVALPAREEVRDPGPEDGTNEYPLEGLLAVEHVAEYVTDELAVVEPPVVA